MNISTSFNDSNLIPAKVVYPESVKMRGIRLVAKLSRSDGTIVAVTEQPYPLGAIRVGTDLLYWLEGISFVNVQVRSKSDLRDVLAPIALTIAIGDVRATECSSEMLLILSPIGLLGLSSNDFILRMLADDFSGWSLAIHRQFAIWTTGIAGYERGDVKRLDLENGTMDIIAAGEQRPGAVCMDEDGVYWVCFGSGHTSHDAAIRMCVPENSKPTTIAFGESAPRSITTDKERIYWIDDSLDGRHVRALFKQDSDSIHELAHLPVSPGTAGEERLIVSGNDLYFLSCGRLFQTTINGGDVKAVVSLLPLGRVISFDIDQDYVFMNIEVSPQKAGLDDG